MKDTGKHINLLSDEDAGKLFKALFDYAENGACKALPPAAQMAFSFIQSYMDESEKKYAETVEKRKAAGAKGAAATNGNRQQTAANGRQNRQMPKQERQKSAKAANTNTKLNINTNISPNGDIESGAKAPPRARFKPPEENSVIEFFKACKSTEQEANKFCAYYNSNGWMVGKNSMKDWKAAARSWLMRAGQYMPPEKPKSKSWPTMADYKRLLEEELEEP